jgi:hypothetical protein
VSLFNTTVNGLDFSFSGFSKVAFSNSTIRSLSLQGSSTVTLYNASVYGSPYLAGNSEIIAYSPFRVRCVDYFGNPLNGSLVTITAGYSKKSVLGQQTADKNGWTSFVLFSELDNATGNFPLGPVTVTGVRGRASVSREVSLALVNKDVTLPFPLPSWSGDVLPAVVLVVIVVVLVLLFYVRGRIRQGRQ